MAKGNEIEACVRLVTGETWLKFTEILQAIYFTTCPVRGTVTTVQFYVDVYSAKLQFLVSIH